MHIISMVDGISKKIEILFCSLSYFDERERL